MSKTIKERFVEALENGITHKAICLVQLMEDEINELYDYRSPLVWASRYGNEKLVQDLREMGAVEVVDKEGMSDELLKILDADKIDEIDEKRAIELIKDGANIEKKYKFGETVLIKAAKNGRVEIIKALLDAGADVTIINNEGKTAIDCAFNDEIKKLLNDALRKQKEKKSEQTVKYRRGNSLGE